MTTPSSIGIIHCVGSRDRNYNKHCSVICCMQSLKFAHLAMERTGGQVYNFYIDMRTPFKDYDEFYQKVLEEGVHFVRGRVAEVTDAYRSEGEEGKAIIQVEDTLLGKQRRRRCPAQQHDRCYPAGNSSSVKPVPSCRAAEH